MAVTRGDDGDRLSTAGLRSGSQGTLFDDSEVPGLPGDPGAAASLLRTA